MPEIEHKRVSNLLSKYCEKRIPGHIRHELRIGYEIDRTWVRLYEERPSFFDKSQWSRMVIAKFKYTIKSNNWTLYWADRNSKWHIYDEIKNPTRHFERLLSEVDDDPTGIFYG
jgi:hypothetical protein